MRLKTENRLLTSFSVSSLTDIVMLLLIFFLLSSSFVTQPGIKVQLPKAETGETPNDKNIAITLTEKGMLFLNAERVTLESLGQKLAAAMKNNHEGVVVIRADKNVTLQNTVQVIDIAKAVGATRFMIATSPLAQ
ncbi:MAG: biopolymer transport protein ExbD/TolR [Bacteroidetes bacterium]|nr:biopolymer transport protein ExbD/TolR [Bacteroidota bacterium]